MEQFWIYLGARTPPTCLPGTKHRQSTGIAQSKHSNNFCSLGVASTRKMSKCANVKPERQPLHHIQDRQRYTESGLRALKGGLAYNIVERCAFHDGIEDDLKPPARAEMRTKQFHTL